MWSENGKLGSGSSPTQNRNKEDEVSKSDKNIQYTMEKDVKDGKGKVWSER